MALEAAVKAQIVKDYQQSETWFDSHGEPASKVTRLPQAKRHRPLCGIDQAVGSAPLRTSQGRPRAGLVIFGENT